VEKLNNIIKNIIKDLINILSLVLPFSNGIARILCESDYESSGNL
tara:strand:+ start:474 stop:608 length:135 start_codon:yes stop_codon:yes gene_type:complete